MTFGEDSRPLDRDAPDEASALKARKACSGYPPVSGPIGHQIIQDIEC